MHLETNTVEIVEKSNLNKSEIILFYNLIKSGVGNVDEFKISYDVAKIKKMDNCIFLTFELCWC